MFWGSSNRKSYNSSDSDNDGSDAEDPDSRWNRSSHGRKRRDYDRKRRTPASSPWFGGLFNYSGEGKSSKKKSGKKGRRAKGGMKFWHPQTSQGWGLLLLTALLFIYMADFLNLLYRDKSSNVAKIPRAMHARYRGASGMRNPHPRETQASTSSSGANITAHESSADGSEHDQKDHVAEPENNQASEEGTSTTSTVKHDVSSGGSSQQAPTTSNASPGNHEPQPPEHHDALVKHPMNRKMVELQVPGGIGELSLNEVKEYYRSLAKAYLKTFSGGIHRQMYFDILRRRTYALTPPGANKGVQSILFQIIDGKVYMMDPYEVPRNSKPFYRTRINEVIWLLSKLAGEGRIKNTEFLMAIHDCVQTVNQAHPYRGAHFQESNPSFTIVSCNFSDNIPFPMWEGSKHRDGGFSGWDDTIKRYSEDDIPWEKKQERAVFRGGNRPSMYFKNKTDADSHCHDVGRTKLQYLSTQQPDILDVSIGGTCGGAHTRLDRLEPRDHHKFKYILYAEGNCMWADRTRHQVFGPSTIIKQETPCGQFFEPLLKPYTHYIPSDFFFSDTVDKVIWARQHDDQARQMVKNANQFGKHFLSLKGIEAYVEVLLEEYTALLVEPDIKLETGATDVTNKKV